MGDEVCKFPPTLYPNHADRARCPVQAYLLYKENRPASMMGDDTPFYLCVNHIDHPQAPWFKAQAVGRNTLAAMLKTMVKDSGIDNKRITNHSLRKTGITELVDHGFDAASVCAYSGHKNQNSIQNYAHISNKRRRNMQSVLVEKATASTSSESLPSRAVTPPPPPPPPYQPPQPTRKSSINAALTQTSSIASMPSVSGLFSGCTITGGVFHITVNAGHAVQSATVEFQDASTKPLSQKSQSADGVDDPN